MFGHNTDWWNTVMLWTLAITALTAVAAFFATIAVIVFR